MSEYNKTDLQKTIGTIERSIKKVVETIDAADLDETDLYIVRNVAVAKMSKALEDIDPQQPAVVEAEVHQMHG